MIINTQRLLLRPVVSSDAADIYDYSKDDNVGPNAGWKPHETLEETTEIMNAVFLEDPNVFGIVIAENNKLIGTIGLVGDPKRQNDAAMMLGYAIGEAYWGKGYMTEAANAILKYGFDMLKLNLISAYCYPHNRRSRNVLKKLGFQYEGTLTLCEKLYDGNIFDNECYAISSQNWQNK